ncbi:uncharacterized protein LOC129602030 isoform X2 [Paramacrobiotus metropolitanus]|uniref:uncharacterized protein LOC129602030 isoform X2 n=1 Tax=Paramacrobiotus metropolitanus TaxID=2943436 RepID=UPI002445BAA6|nr:uncharacterized protein LOC129602030 isoform X2 [Paramacrobiotus metropolitanus]
MEESDGQGARKRSKRSNSVDRVTVEDPPSSDRESSSNTVETLPDLNEVQIQLRGHFNEDFLPTPTTFPFGFRKPVPPCDLQGFMNVAATFRPVLPSNFHCAHFSNVSNSRDVMLQKAGGAVCAAYEIAYGDQIAVYSAFMTSVLEAHLIPTLPQRALMQMQEKLEDGKVRLVQFLAMLPGFEGISSADRDILLAEKAFISNLLHHMRSFYKGEYYYPLPGPEQIPASNHWMEIIGLDSEFLRFCAKFSTVFNGIGLTLTESYLLLAMALFDPRTTTASDKSLLSHLHTFYADALTYIIGYRRRDPAERAAVYRKLNEASQMFAMVYRISLGWFQNVDRALPPFPVPLKTLLQDCLKR